MVKPSQPASPPSGSDVDAVQVGNATYYVRKDVEALCKRLNAAMSIPSAAERMSWWRRGWRWLLLSLGLAACEVNIDVHDNPISANVDLCELVGVDPSCEAEPECTLADGGCEAGQVCACGVCVDPGDLL